MLNLEGLSEIALGDTAFMCQILRQIAEQHDRIAQAIEHKQFKNAHSEIHAFKAHAILISNTISIEEFQVLEDALESAPFDVGMHLWEKMSPRFMHFKSEIQSYLNSMQ